LNSYSIINNNINTYNMNYEIKLPLLKWNAKNTANIVVIKFNNTNNITKGII
jgi:TFIIF-interacting CTD phosphatase-like protein